VRPLAALGRIQERILDRYRFDWRKRLVKHVAVRNGDERYVFRCESDLERWRAETLFSKEEGTVAWIREGVQPGETFYDVGANIGLYTLLAADRVGSSGRVYAFEPHAPNFVSLLHNVHLNQVGEWVVPLCCALHDRNGFFDFHYQSFVAGSSMSQLDCLVDGDEVRFQPVVSERKLGVTVDSLIESGVIGPPHHVKIDVDGNELLVLKGMQQLLTGANRPKSLQVEINRRYKAELFAFLAQCGYEQRARHDTTLGKSLLAAGRDPETIAHNAVFRPCPVIQEAVR
jgi:FkbM family methyltransferase